MSRVEIDGKRRYATPDGEKLPSVTTILDATKSEESKKALNEWRKRMGPAKAQAITTEAAGRGTRMHKWLENYIKTGETGEPGSNPYSIQSHQMAHSIITQGLVKCNEYWGTEVPLYFPKVYAGTTDLVGIHDGSPAIMDHKQSNKLKKRGARSAEGISRSYLRSTDNSERQFLQLNHHIMSFLTGYPQ